MPALFQVALTAGTVVLTGPFSCQFRAIYRHGMHFAILRACLCLCQSVRHVPVGCFALAIKIRLRQLDSGHTIGTIGVLVDCTRLLCRVSLGFDDPDTFLTQ